MTKENRQNLADTDRGWCYNQEEWLEEFLEDKGIFYNDSDSDSETYNNESSSMVMMNRRKYVTITSARVT